jgi:tetratricopeptide (TPR) repeat protein
LSNLGSACLDDETEHLNELRRTMFLDLVDAELELGDTDLAVASAESAAGLWRTDEVMSVKLWEALAQAGREQAINRDFEKYKQAVSNDGGKVSQEAKRKARQLTTEASSRNPGGRSTRLRTPHQLPPTATAAVHGRDAELTLLDALLEKPTGPRLATVSGMPGVGKTQLATFWAQQAEPHFPDGTLYADLQGYSMGVPQCPDEVLARFIRALGGDPRQSSTSELVAMYRTMLTDLAVLVVLDNAVSFEHVKCLLPTGAASRTVVTSRSTLLTSDTVCGVCDVVLRPVTLTAGLAILSEAVGAKQVSSESFAARELVDRCGGLPLALKLVATQARRRLPHGLKALVEELKSGRPLLDIGGTPGAAGRGLREVVSWSVNTLTPHAAHVLQVMALHPGPSIRADLVAYLSGLSSGETLRAIDELLDSSLVQTVKPNRFGMHDVIREYVIELTRGSQSTVDATAVRKRVLDHLLWAGATADRALNSGRELPVAPPDSAAPIPVLADKSDAVRWFEQEHATFLAALHSSSYAPRPSYQWLLPAVLCAYQTRAGHWAAAERLLTAARDADKSDLAEPDRLWANALMLRLLGLIQRKRGKLGAAIVSLQSSIRLCREGGFRLDEAHAHQQLSVAFEDSERWQEALEHSTAAHDIYQELDDLRGVAHTLNTLISIDLSDGTPERAIAHGPAALEAAERAGDGYGKGAIHRNLLRCHQELGQHTEAIAHAEAAIQLYRGESPANEAHVQAQLAESYRCLEMPIQQGKAMEYATNLLTALEDKRDRDSALLAELRQGLARLQRTGD